jgi:tRNA(Ile)-lysidine synthetase-like protein
MSFTPEDASLLVDFWFTDMDEKWFKINLTTDNLVVSKWSHFLPNFKPIDKPSCKTLLGQILLCDQVTRHDKRINNTDYAEQYQQLCIDMCNHILGQYESELNPIEYCFALLPYRHSRQPELMYECLNRIRTKMEESPDDKYYQRFEKATLQSLAQYINPEHHIPHDSMIKPFPIEIAEVVDPNIKFKMDETTKILEIERNPPKEWTTAFNTHISRTHSVCISLSGGVDSMVCSYILKKMGYNVYAVMINYGNRDESNMEVELVKWWCQQIKIHLYIRHIIELKRVRQSNLRSDYEEITRNMRFGAYKNAHRSYCNMNELNEDEPWVVLGHNKNDATENMFANLAKHRSFDNLTAMIPRHTENDVIIYRPILDKSKPEIFAFATERQIPCTFDSTPSWSDRGKMRDDLIPHINSFNPNIIGGLVDFAKYTEQLSSAYINMISASTTIRLQMIDNKKHITIDFPPFTNDLCFWNYVFLKVSREYNMPMVGHKSISTLIETLNKNSPCWKNLSHRLVHSMVIKFNDGTHATIYFND